MPPTRSSAIVDVRRVVRRPLVLPGFDEWRPASGLHDILGEAMVDQITRPAPVDSGRQPGPANVSGEVPAGIRGHDRPLSQLVLDAR